MNNYLALPKIIHHLSNLKLIQIYLILTWAATGEGRMVTGGEEEGDMQRLAETITLIYSLVVATNRNKGGGQD